jgi:hypothetical protein
VSAPFSPPSQRRLKRIVKCDAASRTLGFCRHCGAPVEWLMSVNHSRWLLFDRDAPIAREKTDADGVRYTYLAHAALHWARCQPSPAVAATSAAGASAR